MKIEIFLEHFFNDRREKKSMDGSMIYAEGIRNQVKSWMILFCIVCCFCFCFTIELMILLT